MPTNNTLFSKINRFFLWLLPFMFFVSVAIYCSRLFADYIPWYGLLRILYIISTIGTVIAVLVTRFKFWNGSKDALTAYTRSERFLNGFSKFVWRFIVLCLVLWVVIGLMMSGG